MIGLLLTVVAVALFFIIRYDSKQEAREQMDAERKRGEAILRARAERSAKDSKGEMSECVPKAPRETTARNTYSTEPITQRNQYGSYQNLPANRPAVTKTELLLAWLLGYFGAHKFYRKKFVLGILYVFTLGLFFIGWLGDAIWLTVQYFSNKNGKPVTKGHKIGSYIAGFLCFFMLGSCGNTQENVPVSTEPIVTEVAVIETTDEETTIPETAVPTTVPQTIEMTAETEETAAPETTEVPTTIPTTEYHTEPAKDPEVIVPSTTKATEPREEMVWVPTKGGRRYHSRSSCSNMSNPQEVTISQAKSRGFTPCKKCY